MNFHVKMCVKNKLLLVSPSVVLMFDAQVAILFVVWFKKDACLGMNNNPTTDKHTGIVPATYPAKMPTKRS